jgi:hypothetical protein
MVSKDVHVGKTVPQRHLDEKRECRKTAGLMIQAFENVDEEWANK